MKNKHLTPDRVAQLDGRPIRLSSPYADGKLLTISPRGKVTLELPETGYDQYWRLIPTDDGFLFASSRNGDMVCHHMPDGGSIVSKPLSEDTNDCVWKLGKHGEIYQPNPEGGERYLWLADDKLFATLDGFLAESWVPLSDIEQPPPPSSGKECSSDYLTPFIIAAVLVAVVLVIGMFLRKRRGES